MKMIAILLGAMLALPMYADSGREKHKEKKKIVKKEKELKKDRKLLKEKKDLKEDIRKLKKQKERLEREKRLREERERRKRFERWYERDRHHRHPRHRHPRDRHHDYERDLNSFKFYWKFGSSSYYYKKKSPRGVTYLYRHADSGDFREILKDHNIHLDRGYAKHLFHRDHFSIRYRGKIISMERGKLHGQKIKIIKIRYIHRHRR